MRKLCLNILILLIVILVCVILAELALRIFVPMEDIFIEHDSLLGYRHISNHEGIWMRELEIPHEITINSKGLRDTEHDYLKQEDVSRVLLLGDSYIQAFQVQMHSMISKKLERLMNKKEQKFEVINAGVQGYSTGIEQLYLETKGIKYNPDLVVLYFFIGNDISENYYKTSASSKPSWKLEKNKVVKVEPEINEFYIVLRDKVLTKLYLSRLARIALKKISIRSILNFADKTGMLSGTGSLIVDSEDKQEATLVTEKLLLQMNEYLQEKEIPFVVFLISDGSVFYPEKYSELYSEEFVRQNQDNLASMVSFLDEARIPYINSYDTYSKSIKKGEDPYINERGHWSEHGHELSAQLTYDFLLKKKIII